MNGGVGHNPVEEVGLPLGLYKAARMDCEFVMQEKMDEACKEEDMKNKNKTKRWRKWSMAA